MKICKRGHEFSTKDCPQCRRLHYQNNKELAHAQHKAWIAANPERASLRQRCGVVSRFNITLEQYNDMLKSQDNKCKICSTDQKDLTKSLAIDHDPHHW